MVLSLAASPVLGVVDFNDGGIYNIDYLITENVRVDYEASGMQTTVNLLDGGILSSRNFLAAYENSYVNILGGILGGGLYAYGSSRVDVSAGTIWDDFWAYDSSQIAISGGQLIYDLKVYNSSYVVFSGGQILGEMDVSDNCRVDILGGYISSELDFWDLAIVTIHGSNFAVDGQAFGYGELTSIFGASPGNEPDRRLTGTLVSGEPIDNHFYIGHDAKIILIPEPATIVLLALGIFGLRKRMV
ncbi:MAG: PEP-CTERM sorting domain-containing protein [Planctomycetota bacterium]|jgi:hypothetical protein